MLSSLFGSGPFLITKVLASVPSLVLYMKKGQLKDMKFLAQCQRGGKCGIQTRAKLYRFSYKSRVLALVGGAGAGILTNLSVSLDLIDHECWA